MTHYKNSSYMPSYDKLQKTTNKYIETIKRFYRMKFKLTICIISCRFVIMLILVTEYIIVWPV